MHVPGRFPVILTTLRLQFVYDPYIAPKFEVWREEFRARREARRAQRMRPMNSPHPTHEDDVNEGHRGGAPTSVEMESLGSISKSISKSTSGGSTSSGSELRLRRPNQNGIQPKMLDEVRDVCIL